MSSRSVRLLLAVLLIVSLLPATPPLQAQDNPGDSDAIELVDTEDHDHNHDDNHRHELEDRAESTAADEDILLAPTASLQTPEDTVELDDADAIELVDAGELDHAHHHDLGGEERLALAYDDLGQPITAEDNYLDLPLDELPLTREFTAQPGSVGGIEPVTPQALDNVVVQDHVNNLLTGITAFDAYTSGNSNSTRDQRVLYPYAENSFGVLASGDEVIIAGAEFGLGKVLVAPRQGNNSMGSDFARAYADDGNQRQLLANSLRWLTDGDYDPNDPALNLLTNQRQITGHTNADALADYIDPSWNLNVTQTTDFTSLTAELADPDTYPVVYVAEHWGNTDPVPRLTDAEVSVLLDYVSRGGSLLVKEPYWRAERTYNRNPAPGLQKILNPMGISLTSNTVALPGNSLSVPAPVDGNYAVPTITPLSEVIDLVEQEEAGTQDSSDAEIADAVALLKDFVLTSNSQTQAMLARWRADSPNYPALPSSFVRLESPVTDLAVYRDTALQDQDIDYPIFPTVTSRPSVTESVTFNAQDQGNYLRDYGQPLHLISTGLYANPRSTITIDVPDNSVSSSQELSVWINSQVNIGDNNASYLRPSSIVEKTRLTPGLNTIDIFYGGPVYIYSESRQNLDMSVSIGGAYNMATYTLDETTPAEWDATERAYDTGFAELVTDHYIRTLAYDQVADKTGAQMQRAVELMDNGMEGIFDQFGLDNSAPEHMQPRLPYRMATSFQVSCGGIACATTPIEIKNQGIYPISTDWHELGHRFSLNNPERTRGTDGFLFTEPIADLSSDIVNDYNGYSSNFHRSSAAASIAPGTDRTVNNYDDNRQIMQLFEYYALPANGSKDGIDILRNLRRTYRELNFDDITDGACYPVRVGGSLSNLDWYFLELSRGLAVDLTPWVADIGHTISAGAQACIASSGLTESADVPAIATYSVPFANIKPRVQRPNNYGAQLQVKRTKAGTLHYIVVPGVLPSAPLPKEVLTGTLLSGEQILTRGSFPVPTSEDFTNYDIENLAGGTEYTVYVIQEQEGYSDILPYRSSVKFATFTPRQSTANTPTTVTPTVDTKESTGPLTGVKFTLEDLDGLTPASITADNSTAGIENLVCTATSFTTVKCTLDVITSGDVVLDITDDKGNSISFTEPGFEITNTPAKTIATLTAPTIEASEIIPGVEITFENPDGVDATDLDFDSSTTTLDNRTCVQTSATLVTYTLDIVGSGDITVVSTTTGETLLSETGFVVTFPTVATITAPTKTSETTITDVEVTVEDPDGILATDLDFSTSTATLENVECLQTSPTLVTCTLDVTGSGDLVVTNSATTDTLATETGFVVDAPRTVTVDTPTKSADTRIDAVEIIVTDADGFLVADLDLSTSTATLENLECFQTDPSTVTCTLDVVSSGDLIGLDTTTGETLFMEPDFVITTPTIATVTAPTKSAEDSIVGVQIILEDLDGILATEIDFGLSTASLENVECVQTSPTVATCTLDVLTSGDVVARNLTTLETLVTESGFEIISVPDPEPTTKTITSPTTGQAVRVSASGACGTLDTLTAVSESTAGEDADYDYPLGLVDYTLTCASSEVEIVWSGVDPTQNYVLRKQGPLTPGDTVETYYDYPATQVFGVEDGVNTLRTTLTLTDGQFGDDTGVDGLIVDPVGLAIITQDTTPPDTTTPEDDSTPDPVTPDPEDSPESPDNTPVGPKKLLRTGGTATSPAPRLLLIISLAILAGTRIRRVG